MSHDMTQPVSVPDTWKLGHPAFKPFNPGTLVLKRIFTSGRLNVDKFSPVYEGPFEVKRVNENAVTYELIHVNTGKTVKTHHKFLKRYNAPPVYLMRNEMFSMMEREGSPDFLCNSPNLSISGVNSDIALDSDSDSSSSTSSCAVLYSDDRYGSKDVNLSSVGCANVPVVHDVNYSLYVSGRCVACEQLKVGSIPMGERPVALHDVFPDERSPSHSPVIDHDESQKSFVSLENFISEAYDRHTPRPVPQEQTSYETCVREETEPLYSPRRLRSTGSVRDLPNVQPKVLERNLRNIRELS
ncbi:uncharacterized protein LOC108672653 [Hyalella azteca]|uniref:Uncharacterized protein LOC108672653 n=1 Tax=Hyalella azteca TaxID=294128 RepID=A0A8B7NQ79_HYAAZ|nr:uncharacterized protein LOC108672653 [Hyalella azteca]